MTTSYEILSSAWIQALGWALIHSIWQSFVIFLLVFCVLRFTSTKYSGARYTLALGGLSAIFLTSVITFACIFIQLNKQEAEPDYFAYFSEVAKPAAVLVPMNGDNGMVSFLQANMSFVVAAWFFGTLIFLLRTAGGWLYISTLKKGSTALTDQWSDTLNALAYKLGVRKWVELATSTRISAPIVFGYFKPIVLVPVSLFTGLTPAQVETVFLHELMHIKRNDYLINFMQMFLESIFFFNPFVWIISGTIRREREHCCDDAVIAHHANLSDYAHALTRLEEVRLQQMTLALSLSGNKYHLLNRIKRIMEQSVRKYSVRDRLIPVALLIIGLACASWLTIQPKKENKIITTNQVTEIVQPHEQVATLTDTTKKKKGAYYSRKQIITIGEDGKPNEEIVETFEGDEDLKLAFESSNDIDLMIDYVYPPISPGAFDIAIPTHPMPQFHFKMDSFPEFNNEWQAEFSEEFQKAFQENFADFYQEHREELEKMIENLNNKYQHDFQFNFNNELWSKELELQMRQAEEEMQKSFEQLKELQGEEHLEEAHKRKEQAEKYRHESMDYAMKAREKSMGIQHQKMRSSEDNEQMMKKMQYIQEEQLKSAAEFESAVREELIKDGYIKNDEKIETIHWSNTDGKGNGTMEVNGKKIKDEHKKKYQELHDGR